MARELKGEKLEKELLRLEEMKAYEKENAQYELICGIDEAGRDLLQVQWQRERSFFQKTARSYILMIPKSFLKNAGKDFSWRSRKRQLPGAWGSPLLRESMRSISCRLLMRQ